jgi:hypothetical protein
MKIYRVFINNTGKLEINEMVEMFETNKIPVKMENLKDLFFQDMHVPEERLYLNFYQFMEFALSKEKDQAFRGFMREVKQVLIKNQEKLKEIEEENEDK